MADYRPIDITVYPPIFQQFATYKTVIQGRSPSTVEDYLSDLSLFFRVYKHLRSARAVPLEDITLDDVDASFISGVTRSEVYAVFNYLVIYFYLVFDFLFVNNSPTECRNIFSINNIIIVFYITRCCE